MPGAGGAFELPADPEHSLGTVGDYFVPCAGCGKVVLTVGLNDESFSKRSSRGRR
jgi:hypothetical protein